MNSDEESCKGIMEREVDRRDERGEMIDDIDDDVDVDVDVDDDDIVCVPAPACPWRQIKKFRLARLMEGRGEGDGAPRKGAVVTHWDGIPTTSFVEILREEIASRHRQQPGQTSRASKHRQQPGQTRRRPPSERDALPF